MSDYKVRKRQGSWRIYERGSWLDAFDTLQEAHTYAMQSAAAAELYEPGGLTRLRVMLQLENAMRVDSEYRQRIAEDRLQELRKQCTTS